MKKYPNLFSPLKLGNITLKNRIFTAPMSCLYLSAEGYLTSVSDKFKLTTDFTDFTERKRQKSVKISEIRGRFSVKTCKKSYPKFGFFTCVCKF